VERISAEARLILLARRWDCSREDKEMYLKSLTESTVSREEDTMDRIVT